MENTTAPILLVEGDRVDELRTIRAFEDTGHSNRLLVARTAENALVLLRGCAQGLKFGLLLVDMHLPGIGAKGLVQSVRNDALLRDTKIVVLANHHETDAQVEAESAGADTWTRRPNDHHSLTKLMDGLVKLFLSCHRSQGGSVEFQMP